MKKLSILSVLAILFIAGCYQEPKVEAQPAAPALPAKSTSIITHGEGSPIAVGPGSSVVVNMNGDKVEIVTNDETTTVVTTGQDGVVKSRTVTPTPKDPEVEHMKDIAVSAQTFGKDSPVVVTTGNSSITINYPK